MIKAHAKRIVISAAVGLIATSQIGSAQAQVRNTYHGVECDAVLPGGAGNLVKTSALTANAPTRVVCPVPKTIFNSTAAVTVAVSASGGTACRLESYDVFTTGAPKLSTYRAFPGSGISGLEFSIASSFRGGMYLMCDLQTNGQLLNYLVRE
jgi:hypothetical protein